jgi:hypothetical protein
MQPRRKDKEMTYGNRTAAERKAAPITTGVLDYFPDALLAVGELSRVGNEQHNPGEPLHWAKEKSSDEADALVRHLLDRGTFDTDGIRHSTKVAWRALALLQRELDAEEASNLVAPDRQTEYDLPQIVVETPTLDKTKALAAMYDKRRESLNQTLTEDEFLARQAQSEVVRGPLEVRGVELPGQPEVHSAMNPNSFHPPKP